MEDDNDAAIALLLLHMTEHNKEEEEKEEEALTAMIPKKKPRHRARLTMRKYRGRKRRNNGTVKEENMPSSCRIPSENEIFEVLWKDEQYYDCRVIDFLQVNEKMYYDIQFIEDGIEMHMIDANRVYPVSPCRKLPRRM